MSDLRHAKLRAAGWHHDPVSDRYSAPDDAQDGTQKMYDQASAWKIYEADERKQSAPESRPKDAP